MSIIKINQDKLPPIPNEISDRQFFQQAALDGLITQQEALDAVGPGIIPASMDALIDMLPEEQKFDARMKVRGARGFDRLNQTTNLIKTLFNWTDEQRDAFWLKASQLL